jgi:hypothetical protein
MIDERSERWRQTLPDHPRDRKERRVLFPDSGPRVFIEFSPQQPGGDLTMHVHTVYRDPTNGYGRAFVEQPSGTTGKSEGVRSDPT